MLARAVLLQHLEQCPFPLSASPLECLDSEIVCFFKPNSSSLTSWCVFFCDSGRWQQSPACGGELWTQSFGLLPWVFLLLASQGQHCLWGRHLCCDTCQRWNAGKEQISFFIYHPSSVFRVWGRCSIISGNLSVLPSDRKNEKQTDEETDGQIKRYATSQGS